MITWLISLQLYRFSHVVSAFVVVDMILLFNVEIRLETSESVIPLKTSLKKCNICMPFAHIVECNHHKCFEFSCLNLPTVFLGPLVTKLVCSFLLCTSICFSCS